MAEDDIYHNKSRYEKFIANLDGLTKAPKPSTATGRGIRKYYCKNPVNLIYFRNLDKHFQLKDNSYIRRLRLMRVFQIAVFVTEKELSQVTREDINEIVTFSHSVNLSPKSKADFIRDIRYIWKILFPETDERGRIDETEVPYVVKHLSAKIDRSRERLRDDKITPNETEQLIGYFSKNPQMQFYIALSLESLTRPQEACYLRLKDIEMTDSYAKIWVSSHGKEGVKFLQCLDSFPYLIKWYEQHPYKNDKNSFLFLAKGKRQLTPYNINKQLRFACKNLGIDKRITAYSLKRNGVTFARLRGDSDVQIQHRAGWTSTKQLKTYDMSDADDAFKRELAKRGIIKDEQYSDLTPKIRQCICGATIGFAEKVCNKCKRITDRDSIKQMMDADDIAVSILEKLKEENKKMLQEAIKELKLTERIKNL